MFHALVMVLLLLEFYTFFVLLVLHTLLVVLLLLFELHACHVLLLLMFHTHQVLLILVAFHACVLLLLFMHHLCYYYHLHIIGSGVVRASCFTGGVACCLHFTHHNVVTLSMLFMLCALLLLLLTFQPSSTFPWILSTISLFHTLLSVATTLHSNCVWCGTPASYYVQVLKQ
jgi:hypothetical protein